MNRMAILAVALTGAIGVSVGYFVPAKNQNPDPDPALGHDLTDVTFPKEVLDAVPANPPVAVPGRNEFLLGALDIANERETPTVAVDARGRVAIAWAAETGKDRRTIFVARSSDGGLTFGPPDALREVPVHRWSTTINGRAMAFSTHVLPRLVASGKTFALGWVEAIDGTADVRYRVAESFDGGGSFRNPTDVHGGGTVKPGFTALGAAQDGTLVAAWLEGRNDAQQPFLAVRPHDSSGFEPERLVYEGPAGKGICPCCDLAAVRLPGGSDLVAFRNNDENRRDIWFALAPRGGAFGPPAPLSEDRWVFNGCPHDGPALTLAGGRLHAAWMSAHSGRNRVYVASSDPENLSFRPAELHPGAAGSQGHPKLAANASNGVFAVWDESTGADAPEAAHATADDGQGHKHGHGHGPVLSGGGRTVMLAEATEAGEFGPARPVAPRPGAFQLNASVAPLPDGAALVVYNEIDTTGKRVMAVRVEKAGR